MQADNRFCRNCGHYRDGHITAYNWHRMNQSTDYRSCYGTTNRINGINGLYKNCPCPGYEPKDNLEYVQWLYDKTHV